MMGIVGVNMDRRKCEEALVQEATTDAEKNLVL